MGATWNPPPASSSGATTVADGADVAEGAKADATWSGSGPGTVISILKAVYAKVAVGFSQGAGVTDATTLRVITASDQPAIPVGGNVASGAADSGNPLKVGFRSATDNKRVDLVGINSNVEDVSALALPAVLAWPVMYGAGSATLRMSSIAGCTDGGSGGRAQGVAAQAQTGAGAWSNVRTPAVFKTVVATASGDTAVWTPTAGKKFRVMGYIVYVTSNVTIAGGGLLEIVLRDATTPIGLGFSVFAPATALATFGTGDDSGWVMLGNGFLSATVNNVLNVNLSAALASGEARVVVCGTEE